MVSKYRVDVTGFESCVLPLLASNDSHTPGNTVTFIDEIGKMELFSDKYVQRVRELAQTQIPLVATIAQTGSGFISEIKSHPSAKLYIVTRANRDTVSQSILKDLKNLLTKKTQHH